MKTQKTPSSQNNLKNRAERIACLDFRLYYKAIVIKIVWHWHRNRQRDQ